MFLARNEPRYTAEQTYECYDDNDVVHGSAGNCRHVSQEHWGIPPKMLHVPGIAGGKQKNTMVTMAKMAAKVLTNAVGSARESSR